MILHLSGGQSITLLPRQRKSVEDYVAKLNKKFTFDVYLG
jgi:hypothetical protein